eukprot:7376408-Prymnesium_polylepis.1
MLSIGAGEELVQKMVDCMGVNSLSAEMLLANYFDRTMLARYCAARLGKSDKGAAATLAERIAREWAKPSFAPLPTPAGSETATAAGEDGEAEAAAKRQSALDEIKAKRAKKAAAAEATAAAPTPAAEGTPAAEEPAQPAPPAEAAQKAEALLPDFLETAEGAAVTTSSALSGKVVALYFSAHWCGPCRAFTPKLAAAYEMATEDELPFEVVFVSSDDSEEQQHSYMREMHGPWLRVPYGSPQRNALKQRFGCFGAREQPGWPAVPRRSGIPALVVVGPSGRECVFDARDSVAADGPAAIARFVDEFSDDKWP